MSKIFRLIILFFFITSCQTAKDALTLKKKTTGDEFLVEKKSPLVLPPDYGELPIPGNKKIDIEDKTVDAEEIFKNIDNNLGTTPKKNINSDSSVENFILKKIN
jgi:hypothetical protein